MSNSVGQILHSLSDVRHARVKDLVGQELVHRVKGHSSHRPSHSFGPDHIEERGQESLRLQVVKRQHLHKNTSDTRDNPGVEILEFFSNILIFSLASVRTP